MLWQRGKAYSQDLRGRVLAAADDGEPVGRIASLLRMSVSYVSKVLSRRQRTGQTTALLSPAVQTGCFAWRDPGPGYDPSGCDDRGVAGLAVGDSSGFGEHRPDVEDAGCTQPDIKKIAPRGRAGPPGCCQSAYRMAC
jgi:hypothetical protein